MIPVYEDVKTALGLEDDVLKRRMLAIERQLRQTANNEFTAREPWQLMDISGGMLHGNVGRIKQGSTLLISRSLCNDGLYEVTAVEDGSIAVDAELYSTESARVQRVEYPPDVIEGANQLLIWTVKHGDKAGIASESLARHSVSYAQPASGSARGGYPAQLIAFLRPYTKARV